MPRLSIVIPVSDNLKRLEDSLVSVLENRPDDCQVVVVLRQPYDDPYDLKDEVQFVQSPPGASLTASINAGIAASRAPLVHLLACGVEASPGWAEAALAHFADPAVAAVAPLVVQRGEPLRVLAAGAGYWASGAARRLCPSVSPVAAYEPASPFCGPDSLAGFYRKTAVEASGLLDESLDDALAATDLGLKLRSAGLRCLLEPQSRVYADPAMPCEAGDFAQGKASERLFWRWAPTCGWLRSLALHTLLAVGECVATLWRPRTAARLAGRLAGALQSLWRPQRPVASSDECCGGLPTMGRPHFPGSLECLKHSQES